MKKPHAAQSLTLPMPGVSSQHAAPTEAPKARRISDTQKSKEPPKSVHEVPPKNPPPIGSAPTGPCCYCGATAEGRYGAPESSTSRASMLPLCNRCGPGAKPSLPEIWAKIAEQVEDE